MPRRTDNKSKKSQTDSEKPRKPRLWAVIVGINRYRNEDIKNLNFCANDAVGLAAALQKVATRKLPDTEAIFGDVTILVHSDRPNSSSAINGIVPPAKDNILASLDIFAQAQPEDTILFYFSGHGNYDDDTLNTILCLPETETANLSQTGLLVKTVLAKITASAAKQQLIWLDACHSGGMTSQLLDALLQVVKNNPKIYAIAACDRDEESAEVRELGHGLFTYHLIKGLEGGLSHPVIKADELYQYVYYRTLEYIDRANQLAQLVYNTSEMRIKPFSPQRLAMGGGEFIIGLSSPLSVDRNSRGALVFDGVKPSEFTIDLSRRLATKGGFTYQPYPHRQESIQTSISALLRSPNTATALLYLKGKFQVTNLGVFFVFDDGTKIPRDWLAQELADSPIEQQIIILDCSQTPQINRQIELLKQPNKSQCIVAASTENNWLGQELIEIVENNSVKGLTGTNLINEFSNVLTARNIRDKEQKDFYRSDKGIINVILPQAQQSEGVIVDRNYCPYKGLEAFTSQDKDFFFGRENLTQEIIGQLETNSFLPVVGASGSGKSSVVQAGVIPRLLAEGIFVPQDNRLKTCQVWILRPGENPIQTLASALSNPPESLHKGDLKESHTAEYLEGILHLGVESFVAWLRQQPQPMGVLVIDQFEELFTQASEVNRSQFLDLILGAVKYAGDRFKVIITLRNDFMASCLSIPQLGEIVKQNPIFVPSYLTENEYRQIITAPATRVGLSVQPELVDVLVAEVSTQKGALPLLEFTLEQLWQNRDLATLSLRVYQEKIGGIKKVLQERADGVYQKLTLPQKQCAEWIFTQLVSLGEGQEDTRRRRNLSELIVPKYPQELITSTLNILRDSRLIVMSNQDGDIIIARQAKGKTKGENQEEKSKSLQLSIDSEVTVEIAHEILIRNWQQLRWWLDENREQIRLRERIEEKATEWKVNGEKTDYLIRGAALAQAEEFYVKSADELSAKSQEFIYQSIEDRDRQAKLAKRRRRQIIGGLTGGIVTLSMVAGAALWQLRRATISEINALNNSAEALLASNQELDALITGLKAAKRIKNSWFGVEQKTRIKVLASLQNIFLEIKEDNRLEVQVHTLNNVTYVAFSPDGQALASVSEDSTIRLWNRQGKLLHTLEGHRHIVDHVAFSSDGQILASASSDGMVKLWNRQGNLLHTLEAHPVSSYNVALAWSPDDILASASLDGKVKLWSLEGKLLYSLEGHTYGVDDVAFSPNGQTLASAGGKTVKLWNLQGKLLHTLEGHRSLIGKVDDVAFSPDGQTLASASRNGTIVKLWNLQGELLHTLEGHIGGVDDVAFSPDGQTLASSDRYDRSVKLWNLQGQLLHTFEGHEGEFYHNVKLAFSPDGQTLAFAENDRIKLWNLQGELIHNLEGHRGTVSHVAFSPDGQTLASASGDRTVKLWNLQGHKLPNTLQGHKSSVNNVAFSPDGQTLASASYDRSVKLWNLQGKLLHTLEGHGDNVHYVAFSPDGQTLASAENDRIKLWNLQGELLHTLEGHELVYHLNFSSDGQNIISASTDGTVKLWNLQGELLYSFKGHRDTIYYVDFSSDGQTLASASLEGKIKLWNLQGKLLHNLEGHRDTVHYVTFSPKYLRKINCVFRAEVD